MIGFLTTKHKLQQLTRELDHRNIFYTEDVILYSNQEPKNRYRVFVFGCDVKNVEDLGHRFLNEKKPWWKLW